MTTQSWRTWCYKLGLVSALAISEVLVDLSLGIVATSGDHAFAQIAPDNTLPINSRVTSLDSSGFPVDQIDQGTIRGPNLFHSLREFNVREGRGAYFTNPDGIENILSRVTGNNPSNILGTLGVLGNANLFLMNPNGIFFGPNASLDVNGSFMATTVNAIQFGNQGFFSTSAPNTPSVLTVNPSALLFNQIAAGSIENKSIAPAGTNSIIGIVKGLRVPDGQSLLLLGGNVILDGGGVNAFGGRVELGGARAGTVGLDVNGNNLRLNFPDSVARTDVLMSNGSRVDVLAGGGGDVVINAQNIDIAKGSNIFSGIGPSLEFTAGKAGDINVNATEAVTVSDSSAIRNLGIGDSGNISVFGKSVNIINGSQITAASVGQGDAGNVTIQADTISLSGRNAVGGPVAYLALLPHCWNFRATAMEVILTCKREKFLWQMVLR